MSGRSKDRKRQGTRNGEAKRQAQIKIRLEGNQRRENWSRLSPSCPDSSCLGVWSTARAIVGWKWMVASTYGQRPHRPWLIATALSHQKLEIRGLLLPHPWAYEGCEQASIIIGQPAAFLTLRGQSSVHVSLVVATLFYFRHLGGLYAGHTPYWSPSSIVHSIGLSTIPDHDSTERTRNDDRAVNSNSCSGCWEPLAISPQFR